MKPRGTRILALALLLTFVCGGCAIPAVTGSGSATPTAAIEVIDHDATLSVMGVWSPMTATHGNAFVSGFPLTPAVYGWDAMFDVQAFDSENPFYPMLGESYSIEESTKTLTMKLKPGVVWSDGVPITVEDVKANLSLEINRSYVWDFIDAITVLDDRTITVKFSRYNIILLSKVLGIFVRARYSDYKEYVDLLYDIIDNNRVFNEEVQRWRIDLDGGKKYVKFNGLLGKFKPSLTEVAVTGPFVFTSVANDEIIMTRNEKYWNAKNVHFKTVRHIKMTSTENTVLLIKAGKLDIDGTPVTPETTTQIEKQFPDMRSLLKPVAIQYGLAFNFEKYPVSVPEVRKAISMAIDRTILFDVKKPLGLPGDPYSSGIARLTQSKGTYTDESFMSQLVSYEYDPAKASALLESIGWKKIDGKWANEKAEVVKLVLNSSGILIESEICRDMLADFGFDIEYVPVDANVMWANMEQSKHMIYFGVVANSLFEFPDPWSSFNCIYFYPVYKVDYAFRPAEGEPYAITDQSGVKHDVTRIIADLRAASSDAELRALTHEMAKLTNELCPYTTLFEEAEIMRLYDPKLRYIVEGYDNRTPMVTYDDYTQIRSGPTWSLRMGKLYKVK